MSTKRRKGWHKGWPKDHWDGSPFYDPDEDRLVYSLSEDYLDFEVLVDRTILSRAHRVAAVWAVTADWYRPGNPKSMFRGKWSGLTLTAAKKVVRDFLRSLEE